MTNEDTTVIAGKDDVRAVAELMRLHGWRNAASMKLKFDMNSKHYPSVKAFRAEYGVTARTWGDVFRLTDEVIKTIREEMKGN